MPVRFIWFGTDAAPTLWWQAASTEYLGHQQPWMVLPIQSAHKPMIENGNMCVKITFYNSGCGGISHLLTRTLLGWSFIEKVFLLECNLKFYHIRPCAYQWFQGCACKVSEMHRLKVKWQKHTGHRSTAIVTQLCFFSVYDITMAQP